MTTNTLNRDQITKFIIEYRNRANARLTTATDIVLRNIIVGKRIDAGFTPITNSIKLNNGARKNGSLRDAIINARWQCTLKGQSYRPYSSDAMSDQVLDHINQVVQAYLLEQAVEALK